MSVFPLALIVLGGCFLVCSLLWLVVPAIHGLPWVPTREARIRRALQLAELHPGETLYDLGSGDGRVLLLAAREFGARAVGVEIGPIQCLVSWARAWLNRSRDRVQTRCGNFYKADFREADVVFFYLSSSQISRLWPLLETQLHPGTRVVSIAAEIPNWQPILIDRAMLIYVYAMHPPASSSTKAPSS
jgi:SAM-dependent methyltransferase